MAVNRAMLQFIFQHHLSVDRVLKILKCDSVLVLLKCNETAFCGIKKLSDRDVHIVITVMKACPPHTCVTITTVKVLETVN